MIERNISLESSLTESRVSLDLENLDRFYIDNRGQGKHILRIFEKTRKFNMNGEKEELDSLFEHIKNSKNKYDDHKSKENIKKEALEILAKELAIENAKLLKEVSLDAMNKEISLLKTKISEQNQSAKELTSILLDAFQDVKELKREIKLTKEILFEKEED